MPFQDFCISSRCCCPLPRLVVLLLAHHPSSWFSRQYQRTQSLRKQHFSLPVPAMPLHPLQHRATGSLCPPQPSAHTCSIIQNLVTPPAYTPFPQLPCPPTTSCISEQWASPQKSATCKVTSIPAKDGRCVWGGDSVPACSSLEKRVRREGGKRREEGPRDPFAFALSFIKRKTQPCCRLT